MIYDIYIVSAITPGGCRLGLCAMTTRGCVEEDALQIAKFLVRACNLATELQLKTGKMLKDFKFGVKYSEERKALQQEVEVLNYIYIYIYTI